MNRDVKRGRPQKKEKTLSTFIDEVEVLSKDLHHGLKSPFQTKSLMEVFCICCSKSFFMNHSGLLLWYSSLLTFNRIYTLNQSTFQRKWPQQTIQSLEELFKMGWCFTHYQDCTSIRKTEATLCCIYISQLLQSGWRVWNWHSIEKQWIIEVLL